MEKQKKKREGSKKRKCYAFTQRSHTVMRSQPLSKLNALGFSARK